VFNDVTYVLISFGSITSVKNLLLEIIALLGYQMTEKDMTSILLKFRDIEFSAEGSELFVENSRESILKFIGQYVLTSGNDAQLEKSYAVCPIPFDKDPTKESCPLSEQSRIQEYIDSGIYHIGSDKEIALVGKIPGSSDAEKTRNVALLILYAFPQGTRYLGSELRPHCERQSCYNAGNFASTLEKDTTNFIKKVERAGSKAWTIELTVDGEESAKALLEEMKKSKGL